MIASPRPVWAPPEPLIWRSAAWPRMTPATEPTPPSQSRLKISEAMARGLMRRCGRTKAGAGVNGRAGGGVTSATSRVSSPQVLAE